MSSRMSEDKMRAYETCRGHDCKDCLNRMICAENGGYFELIAALRKAYAQLDILLEFKNV